MKNNDSPYIYEKPLRSDLKQRSKRLAGFSALGLVGMVGIFGGSSIASTMVSANPESRVNEANPFESAEPAVEPLIENTDAIGESLVSAATVEPIPDPAPLVSIPLQQAKPKPNSVKIALPALPDQAFGNTSSATPSVGSGSYATGTTPAKYEARGARHESRDDHENEYENEQDNEDE